MWIVILVIVAVLAVLMIGGYNGLVRMRNQVQEAFSTMDVYLKKRADLVPNLVNTVKGYASHEAETLTKIIAQRNSATTTADKLDQENKMSGAIRSIFALAENYPDLKANTNFIDLQQQLGKIEDDIANARKYYNGCVKQFNNGCMTFPNNLVAGIFHFVPADMFNVDEQDRQNVKVEF